jgi:hypothetical protein
MIHRRTAVWVAVAMAATMAAAELPVNSGFERLEPGGAVTGWRLDTGLTSGASMEGVGEVAHSGVGSLRVSATGHGTATVVSDPVSLEIGQAYRLSAWIRTEGAVADPTTRYPTAVPAAVSMASFPFTEHSGAVGGTRDWTRVETVFFATRAEDRVRLHLGWNGRSRGTAWFDDVELERLDDLETMIPQVTVRRAGDGFRWDHRGWIQLHIEGAPYERGWQHGTLLADEIVEYMSKLAVRAREEDPAAGWARLRFEADALFLRSFSRELLEEMRGIADGAAGAGAEYDGRPVDLLDVVVLNSAVDLGQLEDALEVTPHALTGERFDSPDRELDLAPDRHKCSAFVANGAATEDGRAVFGQIFMWNGYTGVHWNVLVDIVPTDGHRLAMHTFPGGIHSGADFYLNGAGIAFGETTVAQTPWNSDGTPQSDRARRAAQYAESIDDVVRILSDGNNGLYTNDWPMMDAGSREAAILLLGTHHQRLWRTSVEPAPFGLPGFLYSNNNARDVPVRRELTRRPDERPVDPVFSPWNRDLAFRDFYEEHAGRIDAPAAARLFGSSPINRVHACDGKITDSEMAPRMVYLAHHGKTTLRSKFPTPGWRMLPDLPGARPHLALGWSTVSPVAVAEAVGKWSASRSIASAPEPPVQLGTLASRFAVDRARLWGGTVLPADGGDAWFTSGSAAYWRILDGLPDDPDEAAAQLANELADETSRMLWTVAREGDVVPSEAEPALDRTAPYVVPRVKGLFALHQLRLLVGHDAFLDAMSAVHDRFRDRETTTSELIAAFEEATDRSLDGFIRQWIDRAGVPALAPEIDVRSVRGGAWEVRVRQPEGGWHLLTAVEVTAGGMRRLEPLELVGDREATLRFDDRPERVVVNPLWDVPVDHERFFTWRNLLDDFHRIRVVYGTSRHVDFSRDMAIRFSELLADTYTEILPPVVSDAELDAEAIADADLVLLDVAGDNSAVAAIADTLPAELGRGWFRFRDRLHADPDEGLILALPSPFREGGVIWIVRANSALELERMTRDFRRDLHAWAEFRGGGPVERGFFVPDAVDVRPEG